MVGCYSNKFNEYIYYESHSLDEFINYTLEHDLIVGFNSLRFDDWVIQSLRYQIRTNYDLLLECWRSSDLDLNYTFPLHDKEGHKKYGGYKLDTLAIANFGKGKTGSGELAPKLWQQGKKQEVIDYCLEDVRLTNELLQLGLDGQLWHPGTRRFLKLNSLGRCNYG